MSDARTTESDASGEQNRVSRWADSFDWGRYGKLILGAIAGLIVNALIIAAFTGGFRSMVDGLAYLTPAVLLAVVVHDRYNPLQMVYLGSIMLFVTIAVANTITLSVRVFRMGVQAEPLWSVMVIGVVALIFTPGPFLGTWAVRRWWLA